jgi:cytochrome c peroxidase
MKKITFLLLISSSLLFGYYIAPIPDKIKFDKAKAFLGKKLFFDTKLSSTNTISCHTCHNLETGGVDNLKFSFGVNAQEGNINTPTVLNASLNFRQLWSGSVRTLAQQAIGPITNPKEMGHDIEMLVKNLKKDSTYTKLFNTLYKDGIVKANILDAIAEYEKTLITPNSPFDKYLKGEILAISEDAKKGYKLFIQKGCISCHNGVNVGGNSFAKFGVVKKISTQNFGLYDFTKEEIDKNFFKVPTLRNIALTYPYFHHGEVKTLQEAIKIMGASQMGITLTQKEIEQIEAFLKTLSGKIKGLNEY